ncbi:ATP-dependent DNA ligase [Conexibacter sp. DBS9H8]|uniref:ATP-dependent DNA ligase n=1 Tax=Conexibacter sp. DBS9H8 TaxID=2937801 RepID=UPI00200C70B5|nr:ATP-dependent DNA ligase [Conexibacter sp. DBS9H8]
MPLPLSPPIAPALARGKPELPRGPEWRYEPKYDGFRALAFIDGAAVYLQSRGLKPLHRYFPELAFASGRYVIDGEIVIDAADGHEDFGALQNRLHPAASRVAALAATTPARFIAFDLLAEGDTVWLERPFVERREALEALVRGLGPQPATGVSLTPLSVDPAAAEPWLAGGEGVVAKLADAAYAPGKRTAMIKVKRVRTIDCVVVGYRHGVEPGTVGSLILGLYDEGGALQVVGHCSGIRPAEKADLARRLAPYASGERGSADPSRWASERELEWVGLRPELVVEVRYDQVSGGRIRHGTKLVAWRQDKAPAECRLSQLD